MNPDGLSFEPRLALLVLDLVSRLDDILLINSLRRIHCDLVPAKHSREKLPFLALGKRSTRDVDFWAST